MMKTQVGQAPSLVKAVLRGTGVSVLWAVICATVIAKLLDSEIIRMESVGYGSMIAHVSAAFIGARISMSRAGHMGPTAGTITGAAYYLCLLLINALFFGGHFTGLGTTLVIVALGTAVAVLAAGKGRKHSGRRRYKIPK